MKKIMSYILSIALLFGATSVLSPIEAQAEEFSCDQIISATIDIPNMSDSEDTEYVYEDGRDKYKYVILSDGTVKITNAICLSRDVYIPSVIDGRRVTVIGKESFTDNVHHTFTVNGELLIDNLKTVTIPNGVKIIETAAFLGRDWIEEIHLPDSIERIGDSAFAHTTAFKNLVLPKSLKYIEITAFYDCKSITSVTMPDSLTYLGDNAFSGCVGLTEVTLPKGLEHLGREVFGGCENLVNINTDTTGEIYCSLDGVLYSKDKTTLIMYPSGRTGAYVMPSTVKKVGAYACRKSKISSIILSSNLEIIEDQAFEKCENLQGRLVLPDSLKKIQSSSFYGCTGITELFLGANTNYRPLTGCFESLNNIYVSDENKMYISAEGILFSKDGTAICGYPCARTGEYTIPYGIESVDYRAFEMTKLSRVIIPDSVTILREEAFAFGEIQYVGFSKNLEVIDDRCFMWCENLCFLDGSFESLKKINSCAFCSCKSIKNFTIPESLEYLGESAFGDCSSLESVSIESENLWEIREDTFLRCTNLSYVKFPYRMKNIDDSAFEECTNLFFYCYFDSVAQKYAEKYGIKYELMPTGLLYGDINFDSRITTADSLLTLRISVGAITENEYSNVAADVDYDGKITEIDIEYMKLAGDINSDGKITASDSLSILRYTVGADLSSNVGIPVNL